MLLSLRRAKEVLRHQGPTMLFFKIYGQYIRRLFPKTDTPHVISLAGVKVDTPDEHLLDQYFGLPFYEAWEGMLIEDYVTRGDTVIEVGAGLGVVTVKAAQAVHEEGSVIAYEASETGYSVAKDTVNRNGVADRVDIHHAIVEAETAVRYDEKGAKTLDASTLPLSDVLILDCEGAEIEILKYMTYSPRVIIVETHTGRGAPHEDTKSVLKSRGYSIDKDILGDPTGHLVALNR